MTHKLMSYVPLGGNNNVNLSKFSRTGVVPLVTIDEVVNCQNIKIPIGVSLVGSHLKVKELSFSPEFVIINVNTKADAYTTNTSLLFEITTVEDLTVAIAAKPKGIIIKSNEAAGLVGEDSAFILFQKVYKKTQKKVPIWVQGGVGMHTAAAFIIAGAAGVIMDGQLSLFPELEVPVALKSIYSRLTGTETKVIAGCRVLVRPNSPKLPESISYDVLKTYLSGTDVSKNYIPTDVGIGLASSLANTYDSLAAIPRALQKLISRYIKLLATYGPIREGNPFCEEYQIEFPIAQGPMTRVSDVPAFSKAVTDGGGLSFLALSVLKGEKVRDLVMQTKEKMGDKTWGIGILGFVPPELREEQLGYIKEAKPPVVLIAGGRPSQAAPLEALGIKTFLHVPSVGLLDMFIKDGGKRFVFEGRECGGHVGPLSSVVLWEQQVQRLLKEQSLSGYSILFAGGISDSFSTAIVSALSIALVAKGAKVGVLMGTAYLFTEEAVATGAILQQFQDQAIEKTDTRLVETAPGHETRCIDSPFVDFFENEKNRFLAEDIDKKEAWEKLEALNVGRLRIASKGIDRIGTDLVKVNAQEQLDSGMYMIGQVVGLRHQSITIRQLHEETVATASHLPVAVMPKPKAAPLDIAIVGMSCIYPDAQDVDAFWSNIVSGKDAVTEVPDERWNKELYYHPNPSTGEQTRSKWGGFIPYINFDPVEFGIPPQSLAAIDPIQLVSLKIAKEALKDAGYADGGFARENTSVIFGVDYGANLAAHYNFRSLLPQILGEVPEELADVLPKTTEDSFPGILGNVVSGRIANRLDLGGRNYAVDAACASSLTAVDLACQELVMGRSDMVLAGGADFHNNIGDYLMFESTKALSGKGRCATFDAEADGITLGEGCAVVVLKRLKDAQADGDKIYSVIKGIGGSSDGKGLGLTAPRKQGQISALSRAYDQAGIAPSSVGLMEAHGTGTTVGDKTELSAMTELLIAAEAAPNQAILGSVKTQIGHTKCAAGMAGLLKVALSIYHGVKPPTLHLKQPNAYYDPSTSPFAFNKETGVWLTPQRVAGLSAFGFGGTNYHTVLSNEGITRAEESTVKDWSSEIFVFSGKESEYTRQLNTVKNFIAATTNVKLKDIAYTLVKQATTAISVTIIASSIAELTTKIDQALRKEKASGIWYTEKVAGKVAFTFSGQGSQRLNMMRELFVLFPALRSYLESYPEYEKIVFTPNTFDTTLKKQQQETITDTNNAQPLLGIFDLAMANFLQSLGIIPDMLAGHSYGELPALAFAGGIATQDLVAISEDRAKAILDAVGEDKGIMLAVNSPLEILAPIVKAIAGVDIVNLNSPRQNVVAGTTSAIATISEALTAQSISFKKLNTACAFHSPLLKEAKGNFAKALAQYQFQEPTIPVWSNTSSMLYPTAPKEIKKRLSEHVVKPVRFVDQISNMYAEGARVFIEVGPGRVLTQLVKTILGKEEVAIHVEEAGSGVQKFMECLGQYMATGRTLTLEKLFIGRNAKQLNLTAPQHYQSSKTTWKINGQWALPLHGEVPAYGLSAIQTPIALHKVVYQESSASAPQQDMVQHVVQDYLSNIQTIINAQKEVMLGYLGTSNTAEHVVSSSRQSQQNILEHLPEERVVKTADIAITNESNIPKNSSHITVPTKEIVLQIVSDKTGYPTEMLGLDMDMEADLSIDSIKRIEIIGALKDRLGGKAFTEGDSVIEELSAMKTLSSLIHWIDEHTEAPSHVAAASSTDITAPLSTPSSQAINQEDITAMILDIVASKTGYPTEMLGLDMDLEADLSIDSIKRLEIIGVLREKLTALQLVATQNEEDMLVTLSALKSLRALIDWVMEHCNTIQTNTSSTAVVTTTALSQNNIDVPALLLSIVSDKTGYPIEMLDVDMDLEADLSIDSIKRLEILAVFRDELGGFDSKGEGEEQAMEQLANLKTLKEIMQWVGEHNTTISETILPTVNTTQITTSQVQINKEEVITFLLETISNTTGYPTEMIGVDMDLEADLSIDSIKRLEIIGLLKGHLTASHTIAVQEGLDMEQLTTIKTLNGITDWVIQNIANPTTQTSEIAQQSPIVDVSKVIPEEVLRYNFKVSEHPIAIPNANELSGSRLALVGKSTPFSLGIKAQLEDYGATVDRITSLTSGSTYDGLIILDIHTHNSGCTIADFFKHTHTIDHTQLKWLFVCTDIKMKTVQQTSDILDKIQGYSGLMNSLDKEWDAQCRTINVEDQQSLDQIGVCISAELCTGDTNTESFYTQGIRHTVSIAKEVLKTTTPSLALDKESVIIVLGGAQGITSEILKKVVDTVPCTYILVGRSPQPKTNTDGITSLDPSKIRQQLLATGKYRTPNEVEKQVHKILKRNQIAATLLALNQRGGTVSYMPVDIRDEQQLVSLIQDTYTRYGRIDGVIHAAGYLDDKYYHQKTWKSFEGVYDTKVGPLRVLQKYLKKDLKFLALFSSTSSALGNKGQVDYSAANNVFDEAASVLNTALSAKVLAINWGPWKGKGMIDAALEKNFLKQGIASIPLEEGANAFVKELFYGTAPQIILMAPVAHLEAALEAKVLQNDVL